MEPASEAFATLTERQRTLLRLVHDRRNTSEIARITGETSLAAIDKAIARASAKLGATTRVEAARLLHEHETGVRRSDVQPPDVARAGVFPLPLPVPTRRRPINEMDWRQVLVWGVLIALATPALLTLAAMLLSALGQLLDGFVH